MPGSSGLPLAGVEAIVEGLQAFQGDVRQMNSALESIQPRQTLLQRGFSSLTEGIIGFGKGILQWGVDTLASFGQSIIHIAEYALGQLLADAIEWVIGKLKELASATIEAGNEFQSMEIRLNGLNMQEITDSQLDYADATEAATKMTKEQLEWLQKLSATTPYDNTDISNVYTLSRSYGFADESARELTQSVTEFASGMGLSKEVLERVIMNLGQMVQRGKITSTEIRDLARGAFLPVNDILQRIADNMNKTGESFVDNSAKIGKASGKIEDYQDKLRILKQKQSEWTDKTKESTKMALEEQIQELEENIAKERATLGSLQKQETKQITMQEVMKKISTPEGLPAQLFIDAFNEMIKEEPRFAGASERMARTFKAASDNAMDIVKSIGGLNIVKPILDVVGGKIADFTATFTDTDRWDKLSAAATRVGQALSWILKDIFSFLPGAENIADTAINIVNGIADWLNEHRMDIAIFFKNAIDFIQEKVIPAIGKVFTTIRDSVLEFQKSGFSTDFLEKLGFKPETAEKIMGFVDGLRKAFERFFSWLDENGPLIKEFFSTLGEIVSGFIDDLMGGREGKQGGGGDLLDSITRFMKFVIANKDEILKWVEVLWSVFVVWQVLSTIWNIVIGVVLTLASTILGLVAAFTSIKIILGLVGVAFSNLVLALMVVASTIVQGLLIWQLFKLGLNQVAVAIASFKASFQASFEAIKNFLVSTVERMAQAIQNKDWIGLGQIIVQGIRQGIAMMVGALAGAMLNVLVALYNSAVSYLGAHSPSTLFAGLGYAIMQGLAEGISNGLNLAMSAIQNVASSVSSRVQDVMAEIGNFSSVGWAYGIDTGAEKASRAMDNAVKKVTNTATTRLKMRSPSKVFEDMGMLTIEGFAQGIEKAAGLAVGAMQRTMGAVTMPAISSMVAAQGGGDTINNTRNMNLTVNTSAPAEPILQDFNMMSSLLGA